MLDRYADAARHVLGEVAATQGEALDEAARLVADSVAAGGLPASTRSSTRRSRPRAGWSSPGSSGPRGGRR